ncbi:hypothetical protein BJV74DRAFT_884394 [Russula compacta]|nr:hypothetical protein BJV74DRAFT_884394 [Russula compacta]
MDWLYLVLKNCVEPPTAEEIGFASGKIVLDPKGDSKYLKKPKAATENIQKVFTMQQENTAGPWDQAKFEHLLTEWIVAYDQPFDEVRKEEFVKLMTYAHHPAPSVKLPSQEGIQCCVMKMGEDTIAGIYEVFESLEGKVALSLDALSWWTIGMLLLTNILSICICISHGPAGVIITSPTLLYTPSITLLPPHSAVVLSQLLTKTLTLICQQSPWPYSR